jgi:hypothetical protein
MASSRSAVNPEVQRIIVAARTANWSIGVGRDGQIMATYDSGVVGMPTVVTVNHSRGPSRVSLYQPGDNVELEGEVIGELRGNPRERGRQLHELLTASEIPSPSE